MRKPTPGAPPVLSRKPACRNTPDRVIGTARSSHSSHRSSPSTESLVGRPKDSSVVVVGSTLQEKAWGYLGNKAVVSDLSVSARYGVKV